MKKFTAILMLFIACLTSTVNAQCPITKPSFTVQRTSGNSFRFINTTTIDTSVYHVAYTWTFGDGHFIQSPTSDTVTAEYTNTYLQADSVYQYTVELGVMIYKNDTLVCNPYVYDTVKIAICNPVINRLPNDSFTSGTVLNYLQLNNAQIVPNWAWTVNHGALTFDPYMHGFKPTGLQVGDSVELIEFLSDNDWRDDTGANFNTILCSAVTYYVVTDSTTGIFSPAETLKADIYSYHKEVTVTCDNDIKQVSVYSVTGQLVFQSTMNGTRQTFSLTHLTDGVYIVAARNETGQVASKKIVLQ